MSAPVLRLCRLIYATGAFSSRCRLHADPDPVLLYLYLCLKYTCLTVIALSGLSQDNIVFKERGRAGSIGWGTSTQVHDRTIWIGSICLSRVNTIQPAA